MQQKHKVFVRIFSAIDFNIETQSEFVSTWMERCWHAMCKLLTILLFNFPSKAATTTNKTESDGNGKKSHKIVINFNMENSEFQFSERVQSDKNNDADTWRCATTAFGCECSYRKLWKLDSFRTGTSGLLIANGNNILCSLTSCYRIEFMQIKIWYVCDFLCMSKRIVADNADKKQLDAHPKFLTAFICTRSRTLVNKPTNR